jgi:ketosteroid isomerase-like protein
MWNAHMPFIPFEDRPISIDEGSREVRLPHETGVSLTTRDHENDYRRVTMADLMTETNYLNPDVEVIAEINTPASFETFGETLNRSTVNKTTFEDLNGTCEGVYGTGDSVVVGATETVASRSASPVRAPCRFRSWPNGRASQATRSVLDSTPGRSRST